MILTARNAVLKQAQLGHRGVCGLYVYRCPARGPFRARRVQRGVRNILGLLGLRPGLSPQQFLRARGQYAVIKEDLHHFALAALVRKE